MPQSIPAHPDFQTIALWMNILTTGTEDIIVDSGQIIEEFCVTPWEGSGSTEKKQGWNLLLSMEKSPFTISFSPVTPWRVSGVT